MSKKSKLITPRAEDYSRWYTDVVTQAKLADYSPVKGCMVIRPHGYALWENMQGVLDRKLNKNVEVRLDDNRVVRTPPGLLEVIGDR